MSVTIPAHEVLLTSSSLEDGSSSEAESGNQPSSLVLADQVLPPNLFCLPANSVIIYPTLMAPLLITLPRHQATVEEVIQRGRLLGLLQVRSGEVTEETRAGDLEAVGVVVKILKRLKMPDGSMNLLIHSMKRFRVKKVLSDDPHLVVDAEYLEDLAEKSNEMDALTRSVVSHVKKLAEVNPFFTEEMRVAMINAPGPGTVADLVAFALALPRADAQAFLETLDVKARFEMLLSHLRREQEVADIQKKINDEVNTKITKLQREFFLKEQLKSIKRELGHEEDGKEKQARTFRERIEAAAMPSEVRKAAIEEVEKLETLSEQSPEYNVTRNYLETLCALPWSKTTEDQLDLDRAQQILDEEHFGLEKVKERILETLAVRKLKNDTRGSILCLVGPPGVGKTSIGKSIAETLGRKFYRFSLGGMRDEAEIKGHRRTYVGALPGKVIQALKRAGSKNCVLMLDEIDKLGASFQGDPASALLEVLDPEQNATFVDHYLDLPFDLSQVLFVATANTTATIPGPLLDRMEVIELPGYTLEEKERIAVRHVIPKELKNHGLRSSQLKIDREALRRIMQDYAREPGLRILQQLIARLARKAATQLVRSGGPKAGQAVRVTPDELPKWLGPKRFHNEVAEPLTSPGVAVGLAWTAMGGEILFIEATDLPAVTAGGGLKLTGQMGDVMRESAEIAWTYAKRKAAQDLSLQGDTLKQREFHLHIPAGAIPKDGPSAGITMATALYSLLSGRLVRQKLAMTGELSLTGKVLPVGGIKEKLLAAKRAGVQMLIFSERNRKDVQEIQPEALSGLQLHFVKTVDEVFALALESSPRQKKTGQGKVIRVAKRSAPPRSTLKKSRNLTR